MPGIEVDNGEIFVTKSLLCDSEVLVDPKLCVAKEDCETWVAIFLMPTIFLIHSRTHTRFTLTDILQAQTEPEYQIIFANFIELKTKSITIL